MAESIPKLQANWWKRTKAVYRTRAYTRDLRHEDRIVPVTLEAIEKARTIRKRNKLLFYIAGPLTGMTEDAKQRYSDVSELIASHSTPKRPMFGYAPHLHGTDPVAHPDVPSKAVRDIDFVFATLVPDAHINLLDPVAHGNAIEEGWAEMAKIPSLYVVHQDVRLSRLVRGMHNIMDTIVYKDFNQDALPQINAFLDQV